ncbi:MAG: DNA helicase PcrA [Selenomonadaceae bacterium]|nr:DNA helicase PcrA [Selenomonadaceae bacterium]
MALLDNLNDMQQKAAAHMEGPLLIMAGAGSGKTRVLTYRIANLLDSGVSPYEILAITFTNKAAKEMKERAAKLIGHTAENVWLSTFHSFCARFLRREIEVTGRYQKSFTIYDASESLALVKSCLKEMNLSDKQYVPRSIAYTVSSAKNSMLTPAKFIDSVPSHDFHKKKVGEVYELYQKKLVANNALDFDDLLMVAVEILKNYEEVREKYQKRFRYIMVDEYQDTNGAQYQITKLLAAKYRNICVVGDADQSIYGWRGADMQNIMDFEKDYPEATVIKLEQNYRSTKNILQAANAVIKENKNRKEKILWTENQNGEAISVYCAMNEWDEGRFIATTSEKIKKEGKNYGDIAVLYRTNAQSRVIEESFMKVGVPYAIVGGLKFYDRKEIKDILAYIKCIYNPLDSVSLNRIINLPRRGIGATSMGKVAQFAAENDLSLFEVIGNPEVLESVGVSKKAATAFENFSTVIFELMEDAENLSISAFVEKVMRKTGYLKELEAEGDNPEALSRIENLKEFIGVAQDFEKETQESSVEEFLAQVALVADVDSANFNEDKVTLMTFHSAKGLEFPIVFMAGMEEGIFPHARTLMDENELEEERRACYVGITRAEEKLYLTYADERSLYGRETCNPPSRFLEEIPANLVEDEESETKANEKKSEYGKNFSYGQQKNIGFNAKINSFTNAPSAYEAITQAKKPAPAGGIKPDITAVYKAGDKVRHGKWGIGTIISATGEGENAILQIAFPGQGVKNLTQKYAPIEKV